ncbi:hypothetical protein [Leptospira levettii]|uniref:Morphogenetic protein n=1 Tax=Leptospira levettii TaxID=2023178 RepID=A0ABY2MTU2_9LEPT|nr:hypothetical protein [Leptospira levettii]TGL75400.1 hypothetical protein EHQ60_00315 [Leptospira levettii]
MKERPILFSNEMVKAILEGRKTMTRRVVKLNILQEEDGDSPTCFSVFDKKGNQYYEFKNGIEEEPSTAKDFCPHGQIGDILWVKETVKPGAWREDGRVAFDYKASPELKKTPWVNLGEKFEDYWIKWTDQLIKKGHKSNSDGIFVWEPGESPINWIPSIFMPKEACRIKLRIKNIRIKRLNETSVKDCYDEGTPGLIASWDSADVVLEKFIDLWESINGKGSWNQNPWVWVIEFEVVTSSNEILRKS